MNISVVKGEKKKPFKIKTVLLKRIGRVLLWTLIIFLILRGIGTLFITSELGAAEKQINSFIGEIEYRERVQAEAAAFAEAFSIEYLTYERGGDYEERVRRYMPSHVSLGSPGYGKVKAIYARSHGVDWFSDSQLNIKTEVRVQYVIGSDDENGQQLKEDILYLLIPVREYQGRYIVEDYPAIVPAPEKAEVVTAYFSGKTVDSNITSEISNVLESFFKTYYSGSSGEISYYMYDSKNIRGLTNRYTFSRLEGVKVFELSDNSYIVLVELEISDTVSQLRYRQGYHMEVIKDNTRYYVKDFNIRTVNLNLKEDK